MEDEIKETKKAVLELTVEIRDASKLQASIIANQRLDFLEANDMSLVSRIPINDMRFIFWRFQLEGEAFVSKNIPDSTDTIIEHWLERDIYELTGVFPFIEEHEDGEFEISFK